MNIDFDLNTIKLLICDIDGVLTDGRLYFLPDGQEMKVFHVHDGFGMRRLQSIGVPIAVISGRGGAACEQRLQNLNIEHIYLNISHKLDVYEQLISELGIDDKAVAYIGDDINDLPVMERVGFVISVPNAPATVKNYADYITERSGGNGAVREICEMIIRAKHLQSQSDFENEG